MSPSSSPSEQLVTQWQQEIASLVALAGNTDYRRPLSERVKTVLDGKENYTRLLQMGKEPKHLEDFQEKLVNAAVMKVSALHRPEGASKNVPDVSLKLQHNSPKMLSELIKKKETLGESFVSPSLDLCIEEDGRIVTPVDFATLHEKESWTLPEAMQLCQAQLREQGQEAGITALADHVSKKMSGRLSESETQTLLEGKIPPSLGERKKPDLAKALVTVLECAPEKIVTAPMPQQSYTAAARASKASAAAHRA